MGVLQERVLRARRRAGSTVGHRHERCVAVGVLIPVTALSVVPNGWPLAAHVVMAIASAVAMGATVGALTGRTLRQLDDRSAP